MFARWVPARKAPGSKSTRERVRKVTHSDFATFKAEVIAAARANIERLHRPVFRPKVFIVRNGNRNPYA